MEYGQKIKYVRERIRNISLTDLHNITGLSLSYLSDAENGKCNMSIKSLEKVAEALGVSSSYLLDKHNMTLEQLADLNKVELPDSIKEYVAKQKSLPYISLIQEVDEKEIFSLEFLKNLIELHEKEARKASKR